jgi:hypothetical protein
MAGVMKASRDRRRLAEKPGFEPGKEFDTP